MCNYDLYVGYDGVQEFVPAMLALIQSQVAGSRGTTNDKNMVKLEKMSAFYLPPICETVKGSHAKPAVRAELQSKKAALAEDCLKLINGTTTGPLQCSDGASYVEPYVALSKGNSFTSYQHNNVSNGTA